MKVGERVAAISTSIELVDKVSGALNKITEAVYETTEAFDQVDRTTEEAFNPAVVEPMVDDIQRYEMRIQEIEAELVEVRKKLELMEKSTEENTQEAKKLGDAFGGIGSIVAGLGIGYIIKEQVGDAINYASDLTEVQNVVDTVFGESSENVDNWAKTTLNSFGLNELSAKQFAGTMGAMLSSSGLESQAEGMSMALTELAGDMASFYNLDAEEAFNKLRSGISGETEPLKQLGINMSVANLEAYALSQGIKASYSEMSQADQTLLRYGYIMSQTANAQGDFARTQDSYANQTKLLKENWSAFTGELATQALPTLTMAIGLLNDGVTFITENWTVIQPILMGLLTIIGAYCTALLVYKGIQIASAVATGVHAAAQALQSGATFGATAAQYGFNAALLACPITWIIAAIIAVIAIIVAVCNYIAKVTNVTQSGLGIICGALAVAGAFIGNIVIGLINWCISRGVAIYNFIAMFANFFANVFNDPVGAIIHLFADMFDFILGVVESATEVIDTVCGTDLSGTIEGFRDDLEEGIDDIVGEQTVAMEELDDDDYLLEGLDYGDAWDAGAEFGDGLAENFEDFEFGGIDDAYTTTDTGSVADMLSGISSDTSDISDGVNISNENLKYLRDIAEKEAINKFTTAEIKVDMKNNNNINNSMDIDGIVDQLTAGVKEAMLIAAEGV